MFNEAKKFRASRLPGLAMLFRALLACTWTECKPRGVLAVYMTGRSDVIFLGIKFTPSLFFGSRDLPHIFLGLKVSLIGEISIEMLGLGLLWWKILMPGMFWGVKISGSYIFCVCYMKLCRTPPPPHHVYCRYPPLGGCKMDAAIILSSKGLWRLSFLL